MLFGTQLGGGTDINRALAYASGLITRPRDTILVLVSDLYEGGIREEMLRRIASLTAAGVQVIVLLALSDEGAPDFDRDNAAALAALGVPAFACTPDVFPRADGGRDRTARRAGGGRAGTALTCWITFAARLDEALNPSCGDGCVNPRPACPTPTRPPRGLPPPSPTATPAPGTGGAGTTGAQLGCNTGPARPARRGHDHGAAAGWLARAASRPAGRLIRRQ